jgi:hypothetical protein
MNKTNDTERTRELTEGELNHVSGGRGAEPNVYMEIKLSNTVDGPSGPGLSLGETAWAGAVSGAVGGAAR